ncbi:hypothetical protein LCGC14_1600380 [marine sediment metagenome]|uniref:Uncharacterized protein n=1 Tax=marine sediment metagenome TaxID=412755 RepID=A0A0F9IBB0_9ZZZZ
MKTLKQSMDEQSESLRTGGDKPGGKSGTCAECSNLRAENARLQERVEEGEQKTREAYNRMAQAQNQREMVLETGTTAYQSWRSVNDTLKRERDEARALAERRKRAGQVLTWFIRRYAGNSDPGEAVRKYGYAARAAIEEEEK